MKPKINTKINMPVPFHPIPPVKSVKFPLLPLFNASCIEPEGLFFNSLCLKRSLFLLVFLLDSYSPHISAPFLTVAIFINAL